MSEEEQAKHIANLISNIIDLEHEIERKDKVINDLLKKIADLEFEVGRLEAREKECIYHYLVQCKYASEMEDKYITEKHKNDKAIKYIEKQVHRNQQFYEMDKDNLLDILKGDDKE